MVVGRTTTAIIAYSLSTSGYWRCFYYPNWAYTIALSSIGFFGLAAAQALIALIILLLLLILLYICGTATARTGRAYYTLLAEGVIAGLLASLQLGVSVIGLIAARQMLYSEQSGVPALSALASDCGWLPLPLLYFATCLLVFALFHAMTAVTKDGGNAIAEN